MKAFVTGSTGLLGNNLVRELIEQGSEVKALIRSEEKAKKLFNDLPIEYVVGDMENIEAFSDEMKGCEVLFHTAAYFREYYQPSDNPWEKLENINIKGTVKILEEAEKQGIKKAIYVSSSGTIGIKSDGSPGDENTPPHPVTKENLYFKSKVLADKAVNEFVENHEMPVVQILPTWIFGNGDVAPTSSGQMVLDFLKGSFPGTFDGGSSIVDARDVSRAMIDAVERGKNGEKYIISGDFYTMDDIAETLAEVSGVPRTGMKLPNFAVVVYATLAEAYGRITGKPILVSKAGVQTMQAKLSADSSKSKRELGATYSSLEETLTREVNWYRENGFVN